MDSIEELVKSLKEQGVFLKVSGNKLQIKVQKDKISTKNHKALKANKEKIISYLKLKYAPLSFGQERLWFLDQYEHNSSYSLPVAIRMHGFLNINVLEKALSEILSRHEILRTNFIMLNNEPRQVVNSVEDLIAFKNSKYKLEIIELNHLAKEKADKQIHKLIEEQSQKPFDLENDCLIRSFLYTINDQESVLFMNKHHIISDGWSFSILTHEISLLYEAYTGSKPSPLEKLPIQYADYSIWQREHLKGEVLNKQSEYWKNKLSDTVILELPTDKSRPVEQTFNGANLQFSLAKDISEKLNAFSKENDATLFMTLLSVFKVLLNRYTGQDDICVGSPIANRTRSEIEPLIGFFVNTLALRSDLSGDISFTDLVEQVKQTTLDAYDNQDIPFEKVVDIVQLERNLSYSPLFQVMLVLQNNPTSELYFGELSLDPFEFESTVSKFDLTISFTETSEGLIGGIDYNTDLFDKGRIMRMIGHLDVLVRSIVFNPIVNISELEILTYVEKHKLLVEWNDTKADYPKDKCIHQLFEEQVEKKPNNVAIVSDGKKLSYRKLNELSDNFAAQLNDISKEKGLAAIYVEPSLEMIIGVLGILKSGMGFLPLDPEHSSSRHEKILEESNCNFLIIQEHLENELSFLGQKIILNKNTGTKSLRKISNKYNSNDLAYVIYTSGSTGKPKGVKISNRNLVNYITWLKNEAYLTSNDKMLLTSSFAFDLGYTVFFSSLLTGSELHVIPKETYLFPQKLISYIDLERISFLKMTPSLFGTVIKDKSFRINSFSNIRLIMLGGESINTDDVSILIDTHPHIQIMNHYGPTETTIGAVARYIQKDSFEDYLLRPTIGRPIDNTVCYVFKRSGALAPVGCPGELYIGGDGVAQGYLQQPELTAEKFIKNPFSDDPNSRLYKTGDLVRYLPDGNIEFLGRIDTQVKIRGFRIELGEIESVLNKTGTIKDCVVVAKDDTVGNNRLVAYVVSTEDLNVQEIREGLSKSLPDYMVPSLFVSIEKMPLTPNGKINRKALPEPEGNIETTNEYVAPRNTIEEKLVEIWIKVLGVEKVGIHDNFFELGGHSLLATQIISKIRNEFNIELPLKALFEKPGLADLSDIIESTKSESEIAKIAVAPRDVDLPLSFAQERLWFIDQYDHNASYNMPKAVKLMGKLDIKVLEKTFSEIVRRHEVLRTNILTFNNAANQLIHKEPKFELKTVDQSHLPEEVANQKNLELIEIESQKPFDLANDSLIRLVLYKIKDEEHTLFLNKHHIISDGWSISVFLKEISILYKAFSENKQSPLPELEIQYADYAVWQRKHIEGGVLTKQSEYWKDKLSGTSILELPADKTRPVEQTFNGANLNFSLDKDISGKLNAFSKENDVTLFMTLLSAFKVLLNKYTGQDDVCVGSPIANRTRSEIEPLIGFFANTLALRSDLSGGISFLELVKQIKQTTLDAYSNQDMPFEKVVDIVQPERNLSYSPLFQVMLVLQNNPASELSFGELSLKPVEFELPVSKFDLTINFTETAEGLVGRIEYNTDLFDKDRIERMAGHFNVLTRSIISNSTVNISELEILTSAEKHKLLVEWNDTEADYPKDKCIHQLFEEQVEKTPANLALVFEEEELTYRELNEKSNQLAYYLQSKGVKPDTLVGICVDRSLDMIVGLLGILKAGGAYVPIDPTYPEERISYMLEDADCEIVLTQEHLELPQTYSEIISLDADWDKIENEPTENVESAVKSNNCAYVIYTSGSTGKPKGTIIHHKSFVNYISWAKEYYFENNETGNFGLFTSVSFDLTTTCIFLSLLRGKSLDVFKQKDELSEILTKTFQSKRIDSIKLTPSHISLIGELGLENSQIRLAIVGGEELRKDQVEILKGLNREITIINEYGPTEASVGCIVKEIESLEEQIAIGKQINNTQVFILNDSLNIQPVGVPGELYISGDGLARGYLKRPELTAERFIKNPFSEDLNSRLYRTGDLVRYLSDGNIEFIGRIDNQVKIRGFRIEIGEIESVLNKTETIKDCVVVAKEDSNGNKRLVAYIISYDKINVQEIREGMSKSLPDYMVPSFFVSLEKMPLTPNGKIDQKALPEPEDNIEITNEYVAPRNETEQKLAEIWIKILGVEKVGIYDNFFELGGDSIITIQIVSRANQENISLTPKDIFKYQTIAKLAKVGNINELKIIAEQGQVSGEMPLTPIQSWFFEEGFENKDHWNQAVMLKVKDSVEISMVENAINTLVQQHDVLSLAYTIENSKWIQKHNELSKYELEVVDYSNFSGEELSKSIKEYSSKIQGSLSIENGILFKAILFKTKNHNELLVAINHLVVDGVSWRIITEDLQKACLQQISNQEIDLGLKTSSFKQWSEKLSAYANSDKLAKELIFWENIIYKSNNSLPSDYSGKNTGDSARNITVKLNEKLTQQLLKEAGKAYKTEINDLLLTSLAISIEKWTKNNITINLEGHGREDIFIDTDISRTVGWFTTQFPVNLTLEKQSDIAYTIKSIKEQLRAIPQKGVGYGILRYLSNDEAIKERLKIKENNGIGFNYLGQFNELDKTDEHTLFKMSDKSLGVSVSPKNHRTNAIAVNLLISRGELVFNWTYSINLHSRETVEKLAASYVSELQKIIEHCLQPETEGYTSSDFPFCKVTQEELDDILFKDTKIKIKNSKKIII